MERFLIDIFNEACKNTIASYLKVGDDSMGGIRFWTTDQGNLTYLSYIFRNMGPMGTEFNTVAYSITGVFL